MSTRTTFSTLKQNELKSIKEIRYLKELTKNPINIFIISSLLNFSCDNFQQYSALLKEKLLKKLGVKSVTFELIEGMEYSPPSILLEVQKADQVFYKSVFLSLSDNANESFDNRNYSISLPILCVTKNPGLQQTNHIHKALEQIFSCSIRQYSSTRSDLFWILGIAINESIIKKMNDGITMSFSLPNYSDKSATIEIHVPGDSLEYMWLASRAEPTSNRLKKMEIEYFFNGFFSHMKNTYGISFEECNLDIAIFQESTFKFGEKMSTSSKEIAYYILAFINYDCVNRYFL